MNKIKLKPCPFCGSEAVLFADNGVRVICSSCGTQTARSSDYIMRGAPTGNAIYRVVKRWNRRQSDNDLISRKAVLYALSCFNDHMHGNQHYLNAIRTVEDIVRNMPAAEATEDDADAGNDK